MDTNTGGPGDAEAATADTVERLLVATTTAAEADDGQQQQPASDHGWMSAQNAHALTFNDAFMASPQHTSLAASVFEDGISGYGGGTTSILDEPMAGELDLALEGPVDRPGVGRMGGGHNGTGCDGHCDGGGDDEGHSDCGEGSGSKRSSRRLSMAGGGGSGGGGGGSKDDSKSATTLTPSWSELKTKAGKERKRLPLACIACRRKKIRCSGEKPACKHCVRSRTPCVYKVTTRKAAPRTDYMAMLDKRMRRMEDRLIKVMHRVDEDDSEPPLQVRSVVKPAIPGAAPAAATTTTTTAQLPAPAPGSASTTHGDNDDGGDDGGSSSHPGAKKKRTAGEAFGPELNHWALGGSSSSSRLGNGGATRSCHALQEQESEESTLFREGADALPPLELQHHLADVYFEKIYGQAYHLLHRPSYMSKLRKGSLPPVLILSVCAVAARFSDHPAVVASAPQNFLRGEEWASRARDIVTRRYEWPNITVLTCLIILCLHEFGTCQGGRSWALGGQAIRMAYALQLHKDVDPEALPGTTTATTATTHEAPLSFIDREIRRRTMWSCFVMDRFNSSGTDRPTFIKEESVKIQLPIKESHFLIDHPGPTENLAGEPVPPPPDMPLDTTGDLDLAAAAKDNMGVAAYMVRAVAVWGRVINYLNQGGKEMDPHPMWSPESGYAKLAKEAEGLLATLPPALVYSTEHLHLHDSEGMANQFLFLHIAIQQSILFMNRFALSSPGSYSNNVQAQQQQQHQHQHQQHQQKQQQQHVGAVPKAFVTRAGAKAFAAANRISQLLQDAETYTVAAPFVGYCVFLSSTVHIFGIFCGNPAIEATSKANLTINVKFLSKMKRYWGMFHFMTENLREQYRTCADAARQGTPAQERTMAASPIFQYGDWFDRYPHGVSNAEFGDADATTFRKREKNDDSVLEHKEELRRLSEVVPASSPLAGTSPASGGGGGGGGGGGNSAKKGTQSGRGVASAASAASQARTQARRKSIAKRLSQGGSMSLSRGLDAASTTTATANSTDNTENNQQGDGGLSSQYLDFFGAQAGEQTDFASLGLPQLNAPTGLSSVFADGQQQHQHQQQQQQQQPPSLNFFPTDYLSLSLAQQLTGSMPQLDRQLVINAYGESLGPATATAAGVHLTTSALDGIAWDESPESSGVGERVNNNNHGNGAGAGNHRTGAPTPAAATAATHAHSAFAHLDREPTSAWFMPFNMEPPELGQDQAAGMSGGGLDPFASLFGGDGGGGLRHG